MVNMVNLNVLTVKLLEELAIECNITLKGNKTDKIKQILNSGISENKLENLKKKYLLKKEAAKSKSAKKGKTKARTESSLLKHEERISNLEKQVKYLMSKLDGVEIRMGADNIKGSNQRDFKKIKDILTSKVLSGNSITVDEIIKIKGLQSFSFVSINNAINELIDDEIFDASEGSSTQKIDGRIGRLIRR